MRSVFVQGLILMKTENIPKSLNELIKPIKLFHNIAKEADVDSISLAIQSVNKLCPKCKLVLGANNVKQLKEIFRKSSNLINNSIIDEVLAMGKKFSNKLWDPRNWN